MKINTALGLLAGKSSHFLLSKMGRGSTLPGKLALTFDKNILQNMFSYRTILEKTTLQKRFKTHQNDANSEMVTRFKLPFFANYYVFAFLFYEKSRILRIDNMPKMPTITHVFATLFAAKHLVISYKMQC